MIHTNSVFHCLGHFTVLSSTRETVVASKTQRALFQCWVRVVGGGEWVVALQALVVLDYKLITDGRTVADV